MKLKDWEAATFYDKEIQAAFANFKRADTFVDDDDTVLRGNADPTGFPFFPDSVRVP